MFSVRVRGIDTAARDIVKANNELYPSARKGINAAARHLMRKIVMKFGVYQATGGDGGGAWAKLKIDTIIKKAKRGLSTAPLIETGFTSRSFKVKEGGSGRLSASVQSDSDVLAYHVYGAPGANVPMRDPVRITAIEEKDKCNKIINDYIMRGMRGS